MSIDLNSTNVVVEDKERHTSSTISGYIEKIKHLVEADQFTISSGKNRKENSEFLEKYHLDFSKITEVIKSLTIYDFCYVTQNKNAGFEHEYLYVFCKACELDYWGEINTIDVYMKFNLIQKKNNEFVFVVSFHERNKPIEYAFSKND